MVDRVLGGGPSLVCDVATGTAGVALVEVARSRASVVGIDLTESMIIRGRQNVETARAQSRVRFVRGTGEKLPFADATFDALSFTYLLRYVEDPAATIAELARVVKPGGVVANLEFMLPPNPFWRAAWWLYTCAVLPVAGWITGGAQWREVGRFLGPSISGHYRRYPLAWTVEAWNDAGIVDVGFRLMSLGGGLVMWGRRASA